MTRQRSRRSNSPCGPDDDGSVWPGGGECAQRRPDARGGRLSPAGDVSTPDRGPRDSRRRTPSGGVSALRRPRALIGSTAWLILVESACRGRVGSGVWPAVLWIGQRTRPTRKKESHDAANPTIGHRVVAQLRELESQQSRRREEALRIADRLLREVRDGSRSESDWRGLVGGMEGAWA